MDCLFEQALFNFPLGIATLPPLPPRVDAEVLRRYAEPAVPDWFQGLTLLNFR